MMCGRVVRRPLEIGDPDIIVGQSYGHVTSQTPLTSALLPTPTMPFDLIVPGCDHLVQVPNHLPSVMVVVVASRLQD